MTQSPYGATPPGQRLIDFCRVCRIEEPHRAGRMRCSQCNCNLIVAPPNQVTQALLQTVLTMVPITSCGVPKQQSVAIPPSERIHWIAQRPPEAQPSLRAANLNSALATPRYTSIPSWGLQDLPMTWPEISVDEHARSESLKFIAAARQAAIVLGVAAIFHAMRYLVAAAGRGHLIPSWLDIATRIFVQVGGVAALLTTSYGLVRFGCWLIVMRARAYRHVGRLEPRPNWVLWAFSVVLLINIVTAPFLLREAMLIDEQLSTARAHLEFRKVWIAWLLVNVVAFVAIALRWEGNRAGSLQIQADALFWVIISGLLSSAFAWWMIPRLVAIFNTNLGFSSTTTLRRWVNV